MNKKIVISSWIITSGSVLWLLSKIKAESLLMDWFVYIVILFTGALAGNALVKMANIHPSRSQWIELRRLIFPFFTGVAAILMGVLFSATKFLGNPWFGFAISLGGMLFYYWVIYIIDVKYKSLTL